MSGIEPMRQLGWMLVVIGLAVVLAGGLLLVSGKCPFFGRLPGDIMIKREYFTVYFPITSMVIISAVISIILFLIRK